MPEKKDAVDIEIIEAWKEFLKAVGPYIKITGEFCVKNIGKTVMLGINGYINGDNVFTLNDEKIFEYYNGIMCEYAAVTALHKEKLSEMKGRRISEILNGVCEILTAQLKQYEEHTGRPAGPIGGAFKNPVAAEKERVLGSVYGDVLEALSVVSENIFKDNIYFSKDELKAFCFECYEKSANQSHKDFFTFLYKRVIEKGRQDIYKSYSEQLTECARCINSLEVRKETQYFYDALKQECENIESIVRIQVSALKEELEADADDERENEFAREIIGLLSTAYDNIKEKTQELNAFFGESHGTVKKPELMNQGEFVAFLEHRGLDVLMDKLGREGLESGTLSAVQLWKERLEAFFKTFEVYVDEFAKAEYDAKPYKLFLYEMRKRVTDKLMLTHEILKSFRELKEFYNQKKDVLSETVPQEYMKIIDGINESVTIKIETLEDAKKHFEAEASEKLNSFILPEFTQEDEKELMARRLCLWGKEMIGIDPYAVNYAEEGRNALKLFASKLEKINGVDDYLSKMNRQIQKETDEIVKLETSYLKSSALFEIVTFEEIIAYSVSKLRECEAASEYVERCDALEETLSRLCKLHNIVVIAPEPFDFFNSSEHEVLVAEKNPEYKKGQIIKKLNSGFKYNELVLMRANVIAAR